MQEDTQEGAFRSKVKEFCATGSLPIFRSQGWLLAFLKVCSCDRKSPMGWPEADKLSRKRQIFDMVFTSPCRDPWPVKKRPALVLLSYIVHSAWISSVLLHQVIQWNLPQFWIEIWLVKWILTSGVILGSHQSTHLRWNTTMVAGRCGGYKNSVPQPLSRVNIWALSKWKLNAF